MRAPAPTAAQGSWPLSIDRALAVPVGAQLRGQIEYGIACGEIERGARLPSVRELAQGLGVAHMTVAQVYKELGSLGLIVTSPGRGTFVADAPRQGNTPDLGPLRELLDEALERAGLAGYTPRQVSEVLNVLLARGGPNSQAGLQTGVNVLLVGLFRDATAAYAEGLAALLRPEDRVHAVTLEELRLGEGRPRAQAADVVLSLAHRLAETRALLPGVEVIPVGFIPSDATRTRLASLSPLIRLAVVATFEEFLPTFLAGVRRFAPHVSELRASHVHAPDLREVLDGCDAAVYATGSSVVPDLAPGKPSFEYRHTIDPRDIQQLVLPAVEAARPLVASP